MPEPTTPRRRGRPPLTPEQREAREAARLRQLQTPETIIQAETWEEPIQVPVFVEEQVVEVPAVRVHHEVDPIKVHIYPKFTGEDEGDGGIRQIVKAQLQVLPEFDIEIVETAEEAEVIAYHATVPPPYINLYPRKTFIAMCHGMYWSEYEWNGAWQHQANKQVIEGLRVADVIIACSEWVANSIRRHLSRPVRVIYHGVNMEDWQRPPELEQKDFVLWNKTRVDPICDPEPMNQVATLLPDVMFVSTFGQEAANVGLTGKRPWEESRLLILQAGVYLCTSRETFGIGTLEAMAAGLPVVGFNWGGQAEFIEHGVDGWLVTPGDIRGLAEGIRWALGPDRDNISTAARRKAAAFNWRDIGRTYAEVFREAYRKKRSENVGIRTSIIVTHHNLSQYLPDCLASVMNQTDANSWECIVVEDASDPEERDRALQIVQEAQREVGAGKIKFKVLENNVYLAEARNVGIRMARGRYILPLDADDMLDPHAVALLADALDVDRTIDVAYGNVQFREEDGVNLTNYGRQFTPGHSSWPYPFVHEYQLMQRNLLPYCSMFRKQAWKWTGGYRRRCRTAEDADLWCRLSSYGFQPKMVTEADTLIYRNRTNSMSRTQGETEWVRWFPWSKVPEITPAGAHTREPIEPASLDPIVVSVVIPVGPGHQDIVTDAIDSVDAQFFRQWECIVVNDSGEFGSIKEVPAWVKVIDDSNQILPHGVANARNRGIAEARGRYILTLDADDILEPDALTYMVDAIRDSGGNEVIYTDLWQRDQQGNFSVHFTDDYDPTLLTGRRREVRGETRSGMIHSAMILFPKSVWKAVGGYDEALPAWEDWDFQLAIGKLGVCSRRIAVPLFYYRKQTGYRREENMASFDDSRAGIMAKWGDYFEGRRELEVCQRCGAGRTVSIAPTFSTNLRQAQTPPNDQAKLLEYTGERMGSITYRAPATRTQYSFGRGDQKYVLAADVDYFIRMGEFRIVEERAVATTFEEAAVSEPVLSAPGQAL